MDDTLTSLVALLDKGGSFATVIAVWVAYKAGQTAKTALTSFENMSKAVTEIRDTLDGAKPKAERLMDMVEDIDKATQSIDITSVENGDRLNKLLARPA